MSIWIVTADSFEMLKDRFGGIGGKGVRAWAAVCRTTNICTVVDSAKLLVRLAIDSMRVNLDPRKQVHVSMNNIEHSRKSIRAQDALRKHACTHWRLFFRVVFSAVY